MTRAQTYRDIEEQWLRDIDLEDKYLPPITSIPDVVRVISDGTGTCIRCGGELWKGSDLTPVVGGEMHPTCAAEAYIEYDRASLNALRRQYGITER